VCGRVLSGRVLTGPSRIEDICSYYCHFSINFW